MPEPTWPSEEHQLLRADRQVDVAGADRPVVVHGGEADQLQGVQRLPGCGRRRRRRAVHQVDTVGHVHQVAAAGEPTGGPHPGAGAGRLGDHGAGHAPEPVEAVDRARHEQGCREPPLAGQEDAPRPTRRRTGPSRWVRRRAAPARGVRGRRRRRARRRPHAGERARSGVDAASLTVRTESRVETSERPNLARAAADAAADRPATRRPRDEASEEASITASRMPPANQALREDRGDRGDGQPVDEVDPAVGVPGQPVRVHGAGDDLPGGVRPRRCWAVWPSRTADRTRSITEIHHRG